MAIQVNPTSESMMTHTIESEAIAIYIDQFNPADRSRLAALVFSHGAAIQGRGEQAEQPAAPPMSPAEIAIAQTLAEQPEGVRLDNATLSAESGYASVRKHVGPSSTLAKYWGLKNDRGYYLDAADRKRVRAAFPMD